jgi:hypothetical protein
MKEIALAASKRSSLLQLNLSLLEYVNENETPFVLN